MEKENLNSEDFEKVSGGKMKAVELKDGGFAMIDEDAIFETKKDAETAMNMFKPHHHKQHIMFPLFPHPKGFIGCPKGHDKNTSHSPIEPANGDSEN